MYSSTLILKQYYVRPNKSYDMDRNKAINHFLAGRDRNTIPENVLYYSRTTNTCRELLLGDINSFNANITRTADNSGYLLHLGISLTIPYADKYITALAAKGLELLLNVFLRFPGVVHFDIIHEHIFPNPSPPYHVGFIKVNYDEKSRNVEIVTNSMLNGYNNTLFSMGIMLLRTPNGCKLLEQIATEFIDRVNNKSYFYLISHNMLITFLEETLRKYWFITYATPSNWKFLLYFMLLMYNPSQETGGRNGPLNYIPYALQMNSSSFVIDKFITLVKKADPKGFNVENWMRTLQANYGVQPCMGIKLKLAKQEIGNLKRKVTRLEKKLESKENK